MKKISGFPASRAALVALSAGGLLAATMFGASPAAASPGDSDEYTPAERALSAEEQITPEQARERFATEADLSIRAAEVEDLLNAEETGGSYIDNHETLVVTVTSEAAAEKVPDGSDIRVEVVENSEATLAAQADALAEVASEAPGIASWFIDPQTNVLVVEVVAGATDEQTAAAVEVATDAGATVTEVAEAPIAFAPMLGGEQFEFRSGGGSFVCSVGFNARTSSGQNAMVTAGHCVEGASNFTFKGGALGNRIGASFPGNDYAAFTLASRVAPRPEVTTWGGGNVGVAGSREAAIGASICKSGRTTAWTCGSITRKNATVNYNNGDGTFSTVRGMTATNTCTEGGDSGGANISGNQAQAVTSGGAAYGINGLCGEKVGQPNVSYVQPLNPILQRYGLTLSTR